MVREHLHGLVYPLARHLHKPEFGYPQDIVFGAVIGQRFLKHVQQFTAVAFALHINKINHDYAAKVA
jgi:hypothetical protein